MLVPVIATADALAVGAASGQFTAIVAMAAGEFYRYICTVPSWVKQASNPTASAAAGSIYVGAGQELLINGAAGAKLAAIRDGGSSGTASLARLQIF